MEQAQHDFDLTFRPDYWQPSDPISLIIANVKGQARRQQILDVLERRHELVPAGTPLPENLFRDALSEKERIAWGAINPVMMGGEYLPDYSRGEMEIARLVLNTMTIDVVSIRARRSKDRRIHFRVVDEHETAFTLRPQSSKTPLTLGQMISLLDSIESAQERRGQPWMDRIRQIKYTANPERVAHFVTVESVFYPQLGAYYHWPNEQWLSKELAAIAARDGGDQETGEEAAR